MRIKKLELIGFKSFKDRTVIQFDAGITGVVGPNGCGKSNIVDALCWVMGEMSAKQLRGSSMDDVIFAGSDGYAPVGMAEVSMTLENDGGPFPAKYLNHSEIMVTRRLHRSGESGYFINKEPARLKDVQEIFMDTGAGSKGFSIVAQGTISQIITQKPVERRTLIEEAAGITKFKARKKESQRKLVSTEQNLLRLNDIVVELKRQIDSLERQAQKAERYKKIKEQIENLDLWLSSKEFLELREKLRVLAEDLESLSDNQTEGESKTTELEAKVEDMRTQIATIESLIQSRQLALGELQTKSRETDLKIRELRFEIDQAHKNEERTGSLLQESKTRAELQTLEVQESEEKLSLLSQEAEEKKAVCKEKSESFESVQAQIEGSQQVLTEKRREMLTIHQSESATGSQIQALEQQLEENKEKQDSENAVLEELAAKREEFKKRRDKTIDECEKSKQLHLEISEDVEQQSQHRQELVEKVAERRQDLEEFQREFQQVSSRLESLEELHNNFEGFNDGVKKVVNWHREQVEQHADGSQSKYFQPVADVVEIPEQYEVAIEAAMGSRMQVLLTENSDSSMAAMDYLKETSGGRSSFLSNSQLGGQTPVADARPQGDGVLAVVADEIKMPEDFSEIGQRMFGRIAVVDSVKTALSLRADFRDWTFVTSQGDVLGEDGVLSGGAQENVESGYIRRKREIKELTEKKAEWSGKMALAKASLEKLDQQLENLTKNWEEAQKRNLEQEIKTAELKKDLERADTEYENASRAFDSQRKRVDEVQLKADSLKERMEGLTEALQDLTERRLGLEGVIQTLDSEILEHQSGIEERKNEVTELQIEVARLSQDLEGRQRQHEILSNSLQETQRQMARMEEESAEHTEVLSANEIEIEQSKIELEKMMGEIESIEQELAGHKDGFERSSSELREAEAELNEFFRRKTEWQSKINEIQLKIDQESMRQKYICEQVEERYQMSVEERAEEFANQEFEMTDSAAKKELSDLRQKLNRIGEVNLSAIEEFDETRERYEFLKKQQEDLIAAKDQLNRVIERINKICVHRFTHTFEMVNERFKKVFPVLFGGGEAELVLVESEDKDDGIDIIAKPPGKKMQNVTLMSGGEKALTAVSLIFSIFLVKPSPYCLLDEVDAPLDDANVARFNELVNEMAKRSQIILVTHNKYTMEITKKLYGVTMQEKGVSKMVSVSLADARKVLES